MDDESEAIIHTQHAHAGGHAAQDGERLDDVVVSTSKMEQFSVDAAANVSAYTSGKLGTLITKGLVMR